ATATAPRLARSVRATFLSLGSLGGRLANGVARVWLGRLDDIDDVLDAGAAIGVVCLVVLIASGALLRATDADHNMSGAGRDASRRLAPTAGTNPERAGHRRYRAGVHRVDRVVDAVLPTRTGPGGPPTPRRRRERRTRGRAQRPLRQEDEKAPPHS
ncbi:MAG: hypothetical protein S0880_30515, partial [Actinomycetota bacterium]|nr:hypothetical protein [Actinomycetota bacterium]